MNELQITRKPRRHISKSEKIEIVESSLLPGALVAEVARLHNVAASSVVKWRGQYQRGAIMGVSSKEDVVPASEVKYRLTRI
jgi:transposase